ncbi:hypothetical protein [Azospirillum palustre]
MLFSATPLHVSIMPALAVLPLGLYWGWIFARQKPRGVGGGTRLGRDAASLNLRRCRKPVKSALMMRNGKTRIRLMLIEAQDGF